MHRGTRRHLIGMLVFGYNCRGCLATSAGSIMPGRYLVAVVVVVVVVVFIVLERSMQRCTAAVTSIGCLKELGQGKGCTT